MKLPLKILRILSRHTWWWTVGGIVLLAILVSAARLFLPHLEQYRQQLEAETSAAVGQPVTIGGLKVAWHGVGPRLVLQDVRVHDQGGRQALLGFDRAFVDISLPLSLYHRQIEFGDLILEGVVMNVVRRRDGRYELEGVALDQELEGDTGAALQWLLRQPQLVLKDSLVRWRDEGSGACLELNRVNVRLYNEGDHHRLGGDLLLPETMGGALTLRIDAVGDSARPGEWQVNFYFKGKELRLAQWLVDRPALGMHVVNGDADLELWGLWQAGRIRQLRGDVGMRDFYLARDVDSGSGGTADDVGEVEEGATVRRLPALAGAFVWQGDGAAWQLELERLQLGNDWAPSRVHVTQTLRDGERSVEIASSFARLQTLADLALGSAQLPLPWQQRLEQLQPHGDLHDLYLKLRLVPDQPLRYFARARIENLALKPSGALPGFDGTDLQLNLDESGGVADLATLNGALDTSGLFRERLPLRHLQGQVAWRQGAAGWAVELRQLNVANDDLQGRLWGRVDIPNGGASPLLDLHAVVDRGNGARTSRYLPVKIMGKDVVEWLDRGIVAGTVSDGVMVLKGPLERFPFADGSGRFQIDFKVRDGIVDYAPGWPRVEHAVADLTFAGNSMRIHGRGGRILASDIRDVRVDIADFSAAVPRLTLAGETEGATGDLLNFLNQSPLQEILGQLSRGSEASGASHLGLNLDIPLAGDEPIATRGWVSFDNSTLNLKQYGVDMTAIHGRMGFSDHGIESDGIRAEVLGQPAQVKIATAARPKGLGDISFEASGETRLAALERRLDLSFFRFLKGESRWQGRLEIPHDDAPPLLRVSSSLEGTAVALPEGLGKGATASRPFDLQAEFGNKATQWRFNYGKGQLSGAFEELHEEKGSRLNRAELRLGQAAQLPASPGFRVAGSLDLFDYEAWRPILSGLTEGGGGSAPAAGGATTVTDLDLLFNNARLFGQPLHQLQLQAHRGQDAWSASVTSQELAGKIQIPDDVKSPLEMDLTRLYITPAEPPKKGEAKETAASAATDPREVPPLRIRVGDIRYGKAPLGRLELTTVRRGNGMGVEALNLDGDSATFRLRGSWTQGGDGKQRSQIGGQIDIRDLGNLLAGFGYVETVKGGKGGSSVDFHWNGPLTDPSLARLEGQAGFELKEGRLLEVEPGAGRFFGLLSVQALPRRLTLDFSDLFGKGLVFDSMKGHFDFKEGNAVTKDFVLEGPSARVELEGRVGLAARDYDQRLKVTPHVSSGLPLAGAVVGGLGVGAAVLVVEQLLKSSIDRATGIHYRVTGSWDAPVVARQK